MSSNPIHSDLSLWSTLRTRRRHVQPLRGLDATAARWLAKLKHAKCGVKRLRAEADAVVAVESEWANLTDEALDAKVMEIREAFARRTHKQEHIRAAFAAVREVARRETGEKPYPVQIMGAMGLFHG